MFEFFRQLNPLIYLAAILLFVAFLAISFLKPKKSKKSRKAKVEKVFPSKNTDEKSEPITTTDETSTTDETATVNKTDQEDIDETNQTEIDETETLVTKKDETEKQEDTKKEKKKIKIFKEKLKPTIEKVYVSEKTETEKQEPEKEINPTISETDLLEKMQFVKSGKKVSRLKAYTDEELLAKQQELLDQQQIEETATIEVIPEPKQKHFDKTRRLSRCIECGSVDELFCPHLSDKYLNINADRYLKSDEDIMNSLFSRTSQMLANSGVKTMTDDEAEEEASPLKMYKNDRDYMKDWIEKRRREEMAKFIIDSPNASGVEEEKDIADDIDLSAKTLLVVDSVMKRKMKKRA